MTAKTNFLARLQDEISAKEKEVSNLKETYLHNSKLPDSFFDSYFPIPSNEVSPTLSPNQLSLAITNSNSGIASKVTKEVSDAVKNDYGKNRKLVIDILRNEGKAMLKQDILIKFEDRIGKRDQLQTLTNAISGLTVDGIIKGYKPEGAKFRGNYWGLITWFEGDKIKMEHEPPAYDYIKTILG